MAGVCVGAGMLGLLSTGAGAWTFWSMLAVALTMVVMTVSGWMLLESYRGYPLHVSFDAVTRDLLGEKSNTLNNLNAYFVSGILLYAYIALSGLILQEMTGLESHWGGIAVQLRRNTQVHSYGRGWVTCCNSGAGYLDATLVHCSAVFSV